MGRKKSSENDQLIFSTFPRITVGGFVNQLIKNFGLQHVTFKHFHSHLYLNSFLYLTAVVWKSLKPTVFYLADQSEPYEAV